LNKRYDLPIPTWLCLKDIAVSDAEVNFDNWREVIELVNAVSVRTNTIPVDSKYYKGGKLVFKIEGKNDWSGCYIAATPQLASGYGDITTLTVVSALPVVHVSGEFIGLGKIPGEIKARLIKNLLGVPKSHKLVPYLGIQGKAIECLENEEGDYETIIPWTILEKHFNW
jgi:hypothetical protein